MINIAIVPIVTGDIESLVMCKILNNERQDQYPVFLNYGQLAGDEEWARWKKIFNDLNICEPDKLDLSCFVKFVGSRITEDCKASYIKAFIPGRNLVSLAVASSYAYQKGIKNIAIGLLREKDYLYQNQTEDFIVNANFAINSALGDYISIMTPLINLSRDEVMKIARWYNLPINETYQCQPGDYSYCEKCLSQMEVTPSFELSMDSI